ncbi:hypothetical protein Plhal304r1_c034g0106401 [Plasmopara halstedii]
MPNVSGLSVGSPQTPGYGNLFVDSERFQMLDRRLLLLDNRFRFSSCELRNRLWGNYGQKLGNRVLFSRRQI